jgi:hypothetical protein
MKMTTARLAPDATGGVMTTHFLYRRREFIILGAISAMPILVDIVATQLMGSSRTDK